MSPRTTFLSRLIGLYLILVSLSMATHKHATVETMTALIYNPAALYVIGVFAMAAGLATLLGMRDALESAPSDCHRDDSGLGKTGRGRRHPQ